MTLQECVELAKKMGHDVLFKKDGEYISGKYDEVEYAKQCGWKVAGIIKH